MSKQLKTCHLSQDTYSYLYDALLPKYDGLIKYIANRYFDSSFVSNGLEDRLQDGFISLFQAIKGYTTYKIQDAQNLTPETLKSILLEEGDPYIKSTLWNLRACNAKKSSIRYAKAGSMFSLQGINNDTGILNLELESIVVDNSIFKL